MTNSAYKPKSYLPADRMDWEAIRFSFLDRRFVLASHEAADGSFTDLVLDADYEVAGDGEKLLGQIRVLAAYPADSVIHVTRATDAVQPEDLPVHSPLSATSVERGLDRQSMLYQELDADLTQFKGRALAVGRGMEAPVLGDLTGAADGDMLAFQDGELGIVDWTGRDGQYAVFNSAGHLIGVDGPLPDGVPALADNITADSGDTVQEELDRRQREVTTVAAMKALPVAAAGQSLHVSDLDMGGDFAAALTASLDADLLAADTGSFAFVPSTASPTYHWVRRSDDWPLIERFAGADLDIGNPWHTDLILQRALDFSGAARLPVRVNRPHMMRYFAWMRSNAMLVADNRDAEFINDLALSAAYIAAADAATAAAAAHNAGEIAGFVAQRPVGAPATGYADPNLSHCCLLLGDQHPVTAVLATGGGIGTAHGVGVRVYDWIEGDPVAAGQDFFKPVSGAALAGFAAGDLLHLRTEEYHGLLNGTIEHPAFMATFDIIEVTADRLMLAQQIPVAIANCWAANENSAVSGDTVTGGAWFMCRNAVIDGVSFTGRAEKGIGVFRTGFHDCRIYTPRLSGVEGLSSNYGNWSTWDADMVRGRSKVVELAHNGFGMRVHVGHGQYLYDAKMSLGYPIKMGEQVQGYNLTIDRFDALGGMAARSVVYAHESTGRLVVNSGHVSGVWSNIIVHIVAALGAHDPAQTQPTMTQDVYWNAEIDASSTFARYYYPLPQATLPADGLSTVRQCRVSGMFGPALPGTEACIVGGLDLDLDAVMAGGAARWATTTAAQTVRANVHLRGRVRSETYVRDHDAGGLKRTEAASINGQRFDPSPTLVTIDGGGGAVVINPDPDIECTRYTVTNASSIELAGPLAGHGVGIPFDIEVLNDTGSAKTITFSGWWALNGATAPVQADGKMVMIRARTIPASAGFGFGLTAPISGPA